MNYGSEVEVKGQAFMAHTLSVSPTCTDDCSARDMARHFQQGMVFRSSFYRSRLDKSWPNR